MAAKVEVNQKSNNFQKINEKNNEKSKETCNEKNQESNIDEVLINERNFQFARLKDGTLVAKGENYQGCLGIGDIIYTNQYTPVLDKDNNKIKNIKTIYCKISNNTSLVKYVYIISHDGKLMSSGTIDYPQLGPSKYKNEKKFDFVYDNLGKIIDTVETIFSNNEYRTILLLKNKKIMVSGLNAHQELGFKKPDYIEKFTLVPNVDNVINVEFGFELVVLQLENGQIMSTGSLGMGKNYKRSGKFTLMPGIDNAEKIECVLNTQLFVITRDKTLMTCGDNYYGSLGLFSDKSIKTLEIVKDFNEKPLTNVKTILRNIGFTMVIFEDKTYMFFGGKKYSGDNPDDLIKIAKFQKLIK